MERVIIRIKLTYVATVIIALLCVFVGHKIAINEMSLFQNNSQEVVKATVQSVIARNEPEGGYDAYLPLQATETVFEAKVTSGRRKGEVLAASQRSGGYLGVTSKEVGKGDSILLVRNDFTDGWFFNGYNRTNKLFVLGLSFVLGVLIFGGKKGFNTILSLGLTCVAVFMVFVPAILTGKNIYVMSLLVCAYTITMTLLLVVGFSKKALTAAIGCGSGVVVTGIITLIMDRVLFLTGIVDEQSRYLANLPVETPINLKAIIFAGIIIGAMGAIMDVAMSISSSLWEVKEKAKTIKFEALFRSGLTIGRDIMGSMANTLILAYIGSSLSVVLILSVYSNSLLGLLNMEMIVVEILQALAGSLGILFSMPLTAFFCSVFYLKKS